MPHKIANTINYKTNECMCVCVIMHVFVCLEEYVSKWVPKVELIFYVYVCKANRVKAQTAVNLQLQLHM